jgi:hypothetical protein
VGNVDRCSGTVAAMAHNPHFAAVDSIGTAAELLTFRPSVPTFTSGCELDSIAVFVMDHRRREVSMEERSVELHFGKFVVSQQRPGEEEAQRLALEVSYGSVPIDLVLPDGRGLGYELGPEVASDDVDGRAPAVAVWAAGDRFNLVASSELSLVVLVEVARSLV